MADKSTGISEQMHIKLFAEIVGNGKLAIRKLGKSGQKSKRRGKLVGLEGVHDV